MCKDISNYIYEKFDHIFSFYCFHWILDQRQAIKNIFDLLKSGGDILLTFVATCPIYNIYELMASKPWSFFVKYGDVHIAISQLQRF
ncbi:PREDICTED: juvenile hormone acid O-methyltransferase-like [Nicrophorus vespilloides]|uniref:Juvenile hormone acid O-methyltransferase-like n=1 Tax=Nicrophorus vespilloides TaxID=110193 RepID=A0ABM1N0A8_NICVS|nr:PREDICTED: juvenile hormone acid O-methyltransferase-like [Nicrophorus vespilloides]